jgi:hypothetical protein
MSSGSNSGASSACVRNLDWPGFVNARTLEGLTTR